MPHDIIAHGLASQFGADLRTLNGLLFQRAPSVMSEIPRYPNVHGLLLLPGASRVLCALDPNLSQFELLSSWVRT